MVLASIVIAGTLITLDTRRVSVVSEQAPKG
jgi:hypothetical protein